MSHPLLANAFVAAQIEEAVAPFVDQLSTADLDWMRDHLASLLGDDAHAAERLQAAMPRHVEQSGEQATLKLQTQPEDGQQHADTR